MSEGSWIEGMRWCWYLFCSSVCILRQGSFTFLLLWAFCEHPSSQKNGIIALWSTRINVCADWRSRAKCAYEQRCKPVGEQLRPPELINHYGRNKLLFRKLSFPHVMNSLFRLKACGFVNRFRCSQLCGRGSPSEKSRSHMLRKSWEVVD